MPNGSMRPRPTSAKPPRAIVVDIVDWDAVAAAHASTEAAGGPVSILVNSAGIAGPAAALDVYDVAMWKKVIDINVIGTFHVNRAVVPGMKERNYGRIVNIASIAGKEGNPNASAYSASKAGGDRLSPSPWARNSPASISPSTASRRRQPRPASSTSSPLEFIEYMRSKIPRGRFLEVEEAASMVAWLVSKENSFTTASTFDLSGGRATY